MSTSEKTAGVPVVASSSANTKKDAGSGYSMGRYGHSRHWAVVDHVGELVAVVVYRRGAEEVIRRLHGAGGHHE